MKVLTSVRYIFLGVSRILLFKQILLLVTSVYPPVVRSLLDNSIATSSLLGRVIIIAKYLYTISITSHFEKACSSL